MRATCFGSVLAFCIPAAVYPQTHGIDPPWRSGISQVSDAVGDAAGAIGRSLAIDGSGTLHAVWGSEADLVVRYSRSGNGRIWEPSISLSEGAPGAFGGAIAVGPDDTLHAVWLDRRQVAVRVQHRRSVDGGGSWSSTQEVSGGNTRNVGFAGLSVDNNHRVHVVWHLGDPEVDDPVTDAVTVHYARSTDAGVSFDPPARIDSTDQAHSAFPRFDVQGTSGDLIAIPWRENRSRPDWDVFVAVSTDGGASFVEQTGLASVNLDWDPEAVVDSAGVIHLSVFFSRAPGMDSVVYLRSIDQAANWSLPVELSEASSRFPFFASRGSGDLWLFWKDERDFPDDCAGPGRCADLAGKVSSDAGLTWGDHEFVTDAGALEVFFPSFALDPNGVPWAFWSDERNGVEQVFVKRRDDPIFADGFESGDLSAWPGP